MASPPLICLMGPTASGKTALAVRLVERFPCDIVSVDSALVYRGMDIGTAKPDADTLARAPHRLIDICEPHEPYSAARFVEDARREIAGIHAHGRVPLLVGGTMLYFRALLEGLSDLPEADTAVRAAIDDEARVRGWPALHARLAEIDPQAAERIDPNDPQRIQRALEVHRLTGTPISDLQKRDAQQHTDFRVLKLVMCPADRAVLHRRIEQRFAQMLEAGFLGEVRALRARGDLDARMPSMRAVGYRQAWAHLEGRLEAPEWIEKAVAATRQLAKRQITWLRRENAALWYDRGSGDAEKAVFSAVASHLPPKG